VSRRIDLPDEQHVRQAMTEVVAAAREDGMKPTVIALARRLGINHSTFWRHFPDIAQEMVATARAAEPSLATANHPSRYELLTADHARLKRANAELERDLTRATAAIQRLALDNHHLRQQARDAAAVLPLDRERRARRPR
jgi:hypothetical protein